MADADLNQSCTYADLIIQAIRRWPERTAMIDRREQVSYRELGERISRTMQCFAEHGLAKGDGIAQLSLNRVDAFVTVAACYLSGIRYTPMHPLGSLDDHLYTIQDVQISHLVVDPDGFAERGAEIVAAAAELQGAFALGPADFAVDLLAARARHPAQPLATAVGPDDILFIAHTGGTTGRPKGVVHLQRTMVANALICTADWEWMPDPRLLVVAPISHAAGFMLVPCMLLGGTVILEPGFDAGAFIAAVEKHRATMTFLVPTMVYMVLDHPDLPGRDLSSLRTLMFGAAPMSPSRLKEGLALLGPIFSQGYGSYEATTTVTVMRKGQHDVDQAHRFSSCGQVLTGIRLKILDEDGNEVPTGQVGEICVRGPTVMAGYWNRPEETAAVFKHGWYHMGDMARIDEDGYIYIVDRSKDMIISGGFNVYPREIEDVLTSHPAVSAAGVIGVPDEKWGEAVKAVVVRRPGVEIEEADLIDLVKDKKGAVYAPKSVDFVDELPVTALGKPDKKALRAAYWRDRERQVN